MTRALRSALAVALLGALGGCGNPNGDVTADGSGGHAINGSVRVPAGAHSGTVATVNGGIDIGENAVVQAVEDVNGTVEVGAHASAASVTDVNGMVTLGAGARISGRVTTVNGAIDLKPGAEVSGQVKNVNGLISVNGAHVGGGLATVSGDIEVTGDAKVEGGILVERGSWFGSSGGKEPRIVIGPGAVVQGELRFERTVKLYVSEQATIGAVSGATPVRFAGAQPPG